MARKKKQLEAPTEAVEQVKGKTTMSNQNSILELDQNLEDYADYVPLPKGEYTAEVVQSEQRVSDKGNEFFYLVFNIHPDDFPVDYDIENAPEGAKLTWARTQKPDPKNRRSVTGFKNLMRALGMDLKSSTYNPGDWEGKKAKLVVSQSEWQGEMRNQIDRVEAID